MEIQKKIGKYVFPEPLESVTLLYESSLGRGTLYASDLNKYGSLIGSFCILSYVYYYELMTNHGVQIKKQR